MFLTEDDLFQLTNYICPAKQINWLARNGVKFLVSANGHPKVLIAHLNEIMMNNSKPHKRRAEPNEAALLKHMGLA